MTLFAFKPVNKTVNKTGPLFLLQILSQVFRGVVLSVFFVMGLFVTGQALAQTDIGRTTGGQTEILTPDSKPGLSSDLPGLIGQPVDRAIGLQPAADGPSGIRTAQIAFHNGVLLPLVIGIAVFVLGLLIIVAVRFNKHKQQQPAQFHHNTALEIAWTLIPVLILMVMAVPSFKLLYREHNMPRPDLTVKATGNQWYWNYEYPKTLGGGFNFDSNPLSEDEARQRGLPFKLAVNKPLVVPSGQVIQVLVAGADVLHAFFVPAFGVQSTAVPGRINRVWFRAEKPGIYYGQCNELCGVQHYFMPIMIDVKTPSAYNAWVQTQIRELAPKTRAVQDSGPKDRAQEAIQASEKQAKTAKMTRASSVKKPPSRLKQALARLERPRCLPTAGSLKSSGGLRT